MTTPAHEAILDAAKFDLFIKNDGAFLGSLLCNVETVWDEKIPTAQTDGLTLAINPTWFMSIPEDTRPTILRHELWHIAHLHPLRGEGLQHKRFNMAADFVINLMLHKEGNSFKGVSPLLDPMWDGYTTEEVYAALPEDPPSGGGGGGGSAPGQQRGCWSNNPDDQDLIAPGPDTDPEEIVQAVHAAVIAQQKTGYSSQHVEAISEMIKKRNEAKIPWNDVLQDFCQEKARAGLDYTRRNRRYAHVILPARGKRGRLTTLFFFMDVSGSVTKNMAEQFLAEISYIWNVLRPKEMHIVQFDTRIQKIDIWREGQSFAEIKIVGRGGTSLNPVADYIEKHKPTGAVIMTDLDCPQMRMVKGVPILWLCINNPHKTVQQGRIVHIEVPY